MTDDQTPPVELDPDALAEAVRRGQGMSAPDPADAPAWSSDWPVPPIGGQDPTSPPLELDPDKLAAMLPRGL